MKSQSIFDSIKNWCTRHFKIALHSKLPVFLIKSHLNFKDSYTTQGTENTDDDDDTSRRQIFRITFSDSRNNFYEHVSFTLLFSNYSEEHCLIQLCTRLYQLTDNCDISSSSNSSRSLSSCSSRMSYIDTKSLRRKRFYTVTFS